MQTFRVLSRVAVVLVVCAVVVGQASAQLPSVSLSVTGGLAMPMGAFGDNDPNSNEAGYASSGWSAGAHVDVSVIPMFTVVGSFTYASNGVQDELGPALTGGQPYTGDLGSWTTMWPMAGLKYSLGVGPIATIYFTGQGGLVLGSFPEVDITSNGQQLKINSSSASSFAFGLGAGVQLAGKFIIEARFVSGKPKYDITGTAGGTPFTDTVEQPTSIIQLHAGISL